MFKPDQVTQWGKLQILNGGDRIRTAALGGVRADSRNASFVRVRCL